MSTYAFDQLSSAGWHENSNDYKPFLKYYLGVLLAAYREFSSRVETLRNQGLTKSKRMRHGF